MRTRALAVAVLTVGVAAALAGTVQAGGHTEKQMEATLLPLPTYEPDDCRAWDSCEDLEGVVYEDLYFGDVTDGVIDGQYKGVSSGEGPQAWEVCLYDGTPEKIRCDNHYDGFFYGPLPVEEAEWLRVIHRISNEDPTVRLTVNVWET